MEGLVDKGLVKDIGVSNYRVSDLEALISYARIKVSTMYQCTSTAVDRAGVPALPRVVSFQRCWRMVACLLLHPNCTISRASERLIAYSSQHSLIRISYQLRMAGLADYIYRLLLRAHTYVPSWW